jgi:uncharacterized protein YdhG (YjbR/CyaY superfamily)
MAEEQATKKAPARSAKRAPRKASETFTAEERAAMKERAREQKAAASEAEAEADALAKIAAMSGSDRVLAERVHAIVKTSVPGVSAKTWYGMPAYAKDGKMVCFFKCAEKFKSRYATLGFSDNAKLDDGAMWATEFALMEMTDEVEARIAALVKQAVS